MKNTISVTIKERLKKRIYKLAKDSNKDTTYHLNKAIENYLDDLENLKEAKSRLKNRNDKVISSKDLRKSLGL